MSIIFLILAVPVKKIVSIIKLANPGSDVLKPYSFNRGISESWNWINQSLPGEPKLLSSSPVSSVYLASYTSARPYLAAGFASSMPMKKLEERFLVANKFFGVDAEVFRRRLSGEEVICPEPCPKDGWVNLNKSNRFLYINYFSKGQAIINGDDFMSSEYLDLLVEKYNVLQLPSLETLPADYIYYGPWEKQFSQPKFESNKQFLLVYAAPGVSIYKIKK